MGLLNAIMSVGGTIGVFAGPPASDILGRKKAIILGSLIMLLGVGLQGGAANSKLPTQLLNTQACKDPISHAHN